ncbi:MAG: methyltransferase domain-containing protein [Gammaproteobacteria bacterium]
MSPELQSWLVERLACPQHRTPLALRDETLHCASGCRYPVVHGVPILLTRASLDFPHSVLRRTLDAVEQGTVKSLFGDGTPPPTGEIDRTVAELVGATNSNLYAHLVGALDRYPIPSVPEDALPEKAGQVIVDVGCGWGRWCLAFARRGQRAVGVDPSLRAVLAATRVARQLGLHERAVFVVADARTLPFRDGSLDGAFSYSVLQHFPKEATRAVLGELNRVLRHGARTHLHLLNGFGLRSLQVQLLRGFRAPRDFEVRYWRPGEMLRACRSALGPSHLRVDGFFVQARPEDRPLLTSGGRRWIDLSLRLTAWARVFPPLAYVADNLFVVSSVRKVREPGN